VQRGKFRGHQVGITSHVAKFVSPPFIATTTRKVEIEWQRALTNRQ
jgi:hypothetical protein